MRRFLSFVPAVSLLFLFAAVSASAETPALFGDLKPGAYAVGFKVIKLSDPSRPAKPKQDYFGAPDNSDRSRQISIHLWYPAKASAAAQMTFEDYIYSSDRAWPNGIQDAARRGAQDNVRGMIQRFFGNFPDASWTNLLQSKLLARRDSEPAPGRFPLIVGALRELSTTITNEFLASHGYVVAYVQYSGQESDMSQMTAVAVYLGQEIRDMELTVSHLRGMPYVDPLRLGTLGFSGSGLSQLLFGMQYPDVDAVALLETGFLGPRGSSYEKSPLYDVNALRVPLFFSYSAELGPGTDTQFAEFGKMKFSTRHYLKVNVANFHHWDFATEGMAASTVLSIRGERQSALRQGFELTNQYLLNFLNAYVRKDPESLALLRRAPVPNEIARLEEKPGLKPAPSRTEFAAILANQGIERAVQTYRESRQHDPEAAIFQERHLNLIASGLAQRGKPNEAIELFKLNAEAHPQSAGALLALGNAYRDNNRSDEALRQFEKALPLVGGDSSMDEGQKFQFRNNLGGQLLQAKEVAKAIEVFKVNVQAYPQSALALNSLGNGYREAGQKDLALRQFEKALELLPADPYMGPAQRDQLKTALEKKIAQLKQ